MTEWWCDTCLRSHAKASECDLYTGDQVLSGKDLKDFNRRVRMHAKNPPKSGCVVILFVAAVVPAGIWWYLA